MYIVGIDPGLHGAIVGIYHQPYYKENEGKVRFIDDMPTVSIRKGKKTKSEYDVKALRDLIMTFCGSGYIVFIEKTQTLPHGMRSQASYGLGYCQGLFEGMLTLRNIKYELVSPKDWQKHFGITKNKGNSKAQSYKIASHLFPEAVLTGPRGGKLDGRSDALLIAEWGRRHLRGEA